MAIGFIGLGRMGQPMALNVMKAGHKVIGYDAHEDAAKAFRGQGGETVRDLEGIVAECETIITMLPTPLVVREVYLGPLGLVRLLHSGLTVIDMSTTGPSVTREISEMVEAAGSSYIDCPVGRTQAHARAGTLLLLAGGSKESIEEHRHILLAMGEDLIVCGKVGMGQTIKLLNNLLANIITVANAEVLSLGVKSGASVEQMREVFSQTGAGTNQLSGFLSNQVLIGNTTAGFSLQLARKDQHLALEMALECGAPQFLGGIVQEMMTVGISQGWAERDVSSLVDLVANSAGTTVRLAGHDAGYEE